MSGENETKKIQSGIKSKLNGAKDFFLGMLAFTMAIPKRILGSLALFGNMLRHGTHAMKDKDKINRDLKATEELEDSSMKRDRYLAIFEKEINKQLSAEDIKKFESITEKVRNFTEYRELGVLLKNDKKFLEKIEALPVTKLAIDLIVSENAIINQKNKEKENIYAKRDVHIAMEMGKCALKGARSIGVSIYNKAIGGAKGR